MSKYEGDWTLSFLSSVAGQITVSSGDYGQKARHYAWATEESADYWMHFVIDDNQKQGVLIRSFIAPSDKMYAVIGYCEYHDINYELDESLPEEDRDERREKAH